MKEKFKEIANSVNGNFNFHEKVIEIGGGVKDYQEIYSIEFRYDEELVQLRNYRGNKSYGIIESNISCTVDYNLNFSIETNSQLKRLFSIRKEIFQITTEDNRLRDKIVSNKDFIVLMSLVRNTGFQPYVKGCFNENNYCISTEYHLLFREREDVLEPLIRFHKFLVKAIKEHFE